LPTIATLTPPDKDVREYYEHDRLLEKINLSLARARWEETKKNEELNRFLAGSPWEETIKELSHFLARSPREEARKSENTNTLMIPYIPTDFKNAYDKYLHSCTWRRARP
jgi:hypothetical protein